MKNLQTGLIHSEVGGNKAIASHQSLNIKSATIRTLRTVDRLESVVGFDNRFNAVNCKNTYICYWPMRDNIFDKAFDF